MRKPRLLDLFCGGGGASTGYQRAGFEVVGVDIEPQPRYPFEFHRRDALQVLRDQDYLASFDAVHASPVCKLYTTVGATARRNHGANHPDQLPAVHKAFWALDRDRHIPYVIENVIGAPLFDPVRYCGSSFNLNLRRHRLFSSNTGLSAPACNHDWQSPRFRSLDSRMARRGQLASVVGVHGNIQYAGEFELRCKAMGIDWMTNTELSQAIPPVYTQHIGAQLLAAIRVAESITS